jgi:hypothetical protein
MLIPYPLGYRMDDKGVGVRFPVGAIEKNLLLLPKIEPRPSRSQLSRLLYSLLSYQNALLIANF